MIRFSSRQILVIIILLMIVCFGIVFAIQKTGTKKLHGTSTFAPLDIVSGEVSENDKKSTIQDLSTLIKKTLTSRDLAIRPGSYKKTFGTTSDNYTVQFIVDIASAESSYLVTIQVVNGSSIGPYEVCADEQKTSYSCAPPVAEGE